jgi:hypothetical protein|tara:strand:- start:825 stop:1625 length:801 start_codon:yes stop_codon:yes gene_type:complete
MSVDFTHTDYTEELNRIIVAMTGIRNDIRLLRKRLEDPETGVVTSHVMNDLQKALLAVGMSNDGAGNAEVVRKQVVSGSGSSLNAGQGTTSTGTSQENIAKIVQGAPPSAADIDPSIGNKRWPAERAPGTTALPNAGSNSDLVNPATGEVIGVSRTAQESAYTGTTTPLPAAGDPVVNAAQTERNRILAALGQEVTATQTLIRVSGQYYFEADATAGPDDGLRGSIPQVVPYALGQQLGYQSKSGAGGETDYGHDATARGSLGSVQ